MNDIKRQTVFGFIWRLIQNAGTQIITFVVSIVLARILTPDDYGLVAMITVFTTIAMVFITTGFSSAVIQRKEITQTETSTLFFAGIATAIVLYVILYLFAPLVSKFYNEPRLTPLFRVNSCSVLIGSFYSVHQAIFTRRLQFKKTFIIGLIGALAQGFVGILMALNGFGAWALVMSTLSNYIVACIVTWIVSDWHPSFTFSWTAFHKMFSFSIKVLLASLLDTIFNNIRSLIIGKQYSSADLAYYNRGYTFPSVIMTQIDGAMTTVLFSSLSKFQDDWDTGLRMLRRSMSVSLYICVPMMAGMGAVARPMIQLLLTDKWLPSVPYLQLIAILCSTWPLSAKRHALNSKGYSGISLALNLINQVTAIVLVLLTFRISIKAMIVGTITSVVFCETGFMFIYQKYLNYKVKDQILDVAPAYILSVIMFFAVIQVQKIGLSSGLTFIIQIPVGIGVYLALSVMTKNSSFIYLKTNGMKLLKH